jgi:hypothetical protein
VLTMGPGFVVEDLLDDFVEVDVGIAQVFAEGAGLAAGRNEL